MSFHLLHLLSCASSASKSEQTWKGVWDGRVPLVGLLLSSHCQQLSVSLLAPSWDIGEWSECSKTCGLGMQHRQVLCRQVYANRSLTVQPYRCQHLEKPETTSTCQLKICSEWQIRTDWTSVGNGGGGNPSCTTSLHETLTQESPELPQGSLTWLAILKTIGPKGGWLLWVPCELCILTFPSSRIVVEDRLDTQPPSSSPI